MINKTCKDDGGKLHALEWKKKRRTFRAYKQQIGDEQSVESFIDRTTIADTSTKQIMRIASRSL